MVSDTNDDGELVKTNCPHCGQLSSVRSTETLSPKVCVTCQQIHVATLTTDLDDSTSGDDVAPPSSDGQSTPFLGRVSRYRVTKVLGTGAFGTVYQAWDPRLHRWAAIKVPKIATQQKQVVEDFLREARTAARLRHPRIVSVYDADVASGRPFIVAEFVEGVTLANQLSTEAISPRKAAKIIFELAMALHYAHQQGIVHRDIKPGNVMIDAKGHPRLMDFGLAQISASLPSSLDGRIVGTPAYMSPEMARGEHRRAGAASDQYSLGVVLYECLAGHRPFEGGDYKFKGNLMGLLRRIGNESPPRLSSVQDNIPPELDDICSRMVSLHAENRFQDLGEAAKRLNSFLKPATDVSIKTVDTNHSRFKSISSWGMVVAASMAAVLVVGMVLILIRPQRGELIVEAPTTAASSPTTGGGTPNAETDVAPSRTEEPADQDLPNSHVAGTEPAMSEDVNDGEPPADALQAIEFAVRVAPIPELSNLKPTYPPVLIQGGPEELNAFLAEFRALLDAGFPNKPTRIDDKRFATALKHYEKLKRMAPNEPRIPFALAVIRSNYLPSKSVNAKEIPTESALLEQSQQLGGYPFTPAYLAKARNKIRENSNDINTVKETTNSLVNSISTPADWPDHSEKRRVASWLGTVFGYYKSSVSGKPSHDSTMSEVQDRAVSLLNPNERQKLEESASLTQLLIVNDISKIQEAIQKHAAEKIDKAAKLMAQKHNEYDNAIALMAKNTLDGDALEQEFASLKGKMEAEFGSLTKRHAVTMLAEKDALLKLVNATDAAERTNALIQKYKAEVASGDTSNSAQMTLLEQTLGPLRNDVQQKQLTLQFHNQQRWQTEWQLSELTRAAHTIHVMYIQRKGKDRDGMEELKRKMNVFSNTNLQLKQAKLPDRIIQSQRKAKDIRTWVPVSNGDEKDWLLQSIQETDIQSP